MNLVLMGLRGSGKTTIARLLSVRLGRAAVDLDDLTPGVLGAGSVREVWDRHGEGAFRQAEVVALAGALAVDGRIVALGGGTPTAPLAAELLRDEARAGRAAIVYLRATPTTLRGRLAGADNAHRPALTPAGSVVDEVASVFAARDPLYRELSTLTIEVDAMTAEGVVDRIAEGV